MSYLSPKSAVIDMNFNLRWTNPQESKFYKHNFDFKKLKNGNKTACVFKERFVRILDTLYYKHVNKFKNQ